MSWKTTHLEARTSTNGAVDADVVFVYQDGGKKAVPPTGAYANAVERLRKADAFNGRLSGQQFVRFGGKAPADSVLFVGAGPAAELTEEKARQAGGNAWAKLCAEKVLKVAVQIDTLFEARGLPAGANRIALVRAFAEGLVLNAYKFDKHKSKADNGDGDYFCPTKVTFVTHDKELKAGLDRELSRAMAVAEAVQVTRDWSNEPANTGIPEYYAAEARKLAKQYGLKVKVLNEAEAAREKMNLFLGVGQGSEREGRVIVLEYAPKGVKNPKTIALVGKGITFDTGGISIKPSARMEEMKHDMTGAATMMGATILASLWKVPTRIVCVLGFTENMPDGNAIVPSTVIKARNGKTVEIINTDAEGRLILADLLDLAQDYKPDAVVDAATLTGAVSIALGKMCCGVLGNNQILVDAIKKAGDTNGERLWQLPCWDDYFEDMKSDTADMRNSCNDSNGGTIRGAVFLKQFIRKGVPWAHLDIAATATGLTHLSYLPKKGANGTYVRTLAQLAMDF